MHGTMSRGVSTLAGHSLCRHLLPRPMAALIGRIPHPRLRLNVLHNLVEEHGEFEEPKFHHNTFLHFLRTLGLRTEELENRAPVVAVRAFNSILTCACALDELEVGVCCLGIIEHAFARISALIGRTVVERGWIPADGSCTTIFTLKSTTVMPRSSTRSWKIGGPTRRAVTYIDQGLEAGATLLTGCTRIAGLRSGSALSIGGICLGGPRKAAGKSAASRCLRRF